MGRENKFRCERITWRNFQRLSRDLALKIHAAGFQPEMIVAIERGGYMPARVLADYFDVMNVAGIKIEHYFGLTRRSKAFVRYPLPAEASLRGKNVLLVDDVSDSGVTFEIALEHLRRRGEPCDIKCAVLHHKATSSFAPDFYARRIIKWRWLIYPWAVMEDISSLTHTMRPSMRRIPELKQKLKRDYGLVVSDRDLQDMLAMDSSSNIAAD